MSGSSQYRHLITNDYLWKEFIINNVERMNLNNIYDIEKVLENLNFSGNITSSFYQVLYSRNFNLDETKK